MGLRENKDFWMLMQILCFAIAGLCMGTNDFMFSNSKMYLTQLFLNSFNPEYTITLPPTMWELDPLWGLVSATTFLSVPALMLAGCLLTGRYGHLSSKTQILFAVAGLIVYSACWDWIFATFIYNYWTPEMRGTEVAWLPLAFVGGEVFGISFTWEFGWFFIYMRFMFALLILYLARRYEKSVVVEE